MNSIQDLDSDFQTYLSNFLKLCQNPEDNNFFDLVTQKARSDDPNDFKLFLEYNLYIFQNPQIHQSASWFSVILIMNAFRRISDIEDKWFDEKIMQIHQEVKNIIISGLGNQNVPIRNVCSTIIAIIANLEKDSWQNLCEMLIRNIKMQNENHLLALGSIRCLAELFYYPFIRNSKKEALPDFMIDIIMLLVYAIGEESLYIPSRADACNAFIEITEQFPVTYDPEMVDMIIQIIVNSLKFDDLYSILYQVLFVLLKKNYNNLNQNDENTIKNIKNLIHSEIANRTGFYKITNIVFLSQFANFERKKDQPLYNFSCSFAPEFVDQLLQCLIDIEDPQNQLPEDPFAVTVHMAAITTLRSLFHVNSQVIFESVDHFFTEYIGSQNWIEVHAAIFSIASVCDEPLTTINEPYYNTVKDFLESVLPFIITHAGENAMCLRTKETSMWIILNILECYPTIAESDEVVTKIFSLFYETMNLEFPPIIIGRACNIFIATAKICNKFLLDSNFKKIFDIIFMIIQNIQPSMNSNEIRKPFEALDALISNCTSSCDQQLFEIFNMFANFVQSGNCPVQLVPPMCLSISIFIRQIPDFIRPNAEHHTLLFIKLIDITTQSTSIFQQNHYNFTELDYDKWLNILIILANIIEIIKENYQTFASLISNSIFNALNSNYQDLVFFSLKTLGKLYKTFPKEIMAQYFDQSLTAISFLISSKPPECILPLRSSIIYVYAHMLANLGSEYIFFENEEHKEILIRIDQAWRTESDEDNYTELYMVIIHAYKCLFHGFTQKRDLLKKECDKIFQFLDMMYFKNRYNDELLRSTYELLKLIGQTLKSQINVKINKRNIRKIVELGFDNPNLDFIAKELMHFLKYKI